MPKIKALLVPVDFSTVAAAAFHYALRLADKYPARIDLLHCLPSAVSTPGTARLLVDRAGELKQEAAAKMTDFRSRGIDVAMKELTGIPEVCSLIKAGELGTVVANRSAAGEVDLIVMGSEGEDKPLSGLVGTNTSFLIDKASVPVLIVPDEATYRPPSRICYATDLEHLDPFQINEVLDLFAPFTPSVDFVYVATTDRDETEFTMNLLRRVIDRPGLHDRANFIRLREDNEVAALLSYAQTSGAGLLVMNRPRRSWLHRLWKKSHTREAMLKSNMPLLILHEAEQDA